MREQDPDRAARIFLRIAGAFFLTVFALPLFLRP